MRYSPHRKLTWQRDPRAGRARVFYDSRENQRIAMPADLDDVFARIRLRCAKKCNDNFIDLLFRVFVRPGANNGRSMLQMGIRGM